MDVRDFVESLEELADEWEEFECSGNKEECDNCPLNKVVYPGEWQTDNKAITICDILNELTDRNLYKEEE